MPEYDQFSLQRTHNMIDTSVSAYWPSITFLKSLTYTVTDPRLCRDNWNLNLCDVKELILKYGTLKVKFKVPRAGSGLFFNHHLTWKSKRDKTNHRKFMGKGKNQNKTEYLTDIFNAIMLYTGSCFGLRRRYHINMLQRCFT